jgi:predicted dehydrogenase
MTASNRRDFIKAGSVAALAAAAVPAVRAAGDDKIKVGLIGCGGRGSGAIRDSLTADKSVIVHSIGDVFEPKVTNLESNLTKQYKDRVDVKGRAFSGLDSYKQVIDSGADVIILATPPGFRPIHLAYAVEKSKHIFCEKPVAVDAPGIRKCLELVEESKKKNLAIVAGTQRRHQKCYLEVEKRVKNGDIGEIVGGRCAWNGDGIWFNKRQDGESDIEYQLRNWYHFLWLCGDHIVEQHVHNLDVMNWFIGAHPLKAVGMGGRMGGTSARPNGDPQEVGHIFDHFAVEFEYPNGVKIASYCRHYPGPTDVSEMIVGTKGTIRTADGQASLNGKPIPFEDSKPYVQEHKDLIASIKAGGKHVNELQNVTESTMTAIMGRMATYTAVKPTLTWKQALESQEDTMPKDWTLKSEHKVGPTPVPGKTKFV